MDLNTAKLKFLDLVDRVQGLQYAENIMFWDMSTGAGNRGVSARTNAFGVLSGQLHETITSQTLLACLEVLEANCEYLTDIESDMVEEIRFRVDRLSKIPANRYKAYTELKTEATGKWEIAKENKDFRIFQPYLKKIVAFKREFAQYYGYEGHIYNALLEDYERGMTVETLDPFFKALKSTIVPFVKKIQSQGKSPDDDFLYLSYPVEKQKKICESMLETIGFNLEAGTLEKSVHPFTVGIDVTDVRLTTRYNPENLTMALFSTIHEGGHGVYEQNFGDDISSTILADGSTSGIHESQSRLFENNFARSEAFWTYFYGDLQKTFKKQLDYVPLEMFVKAINRVEPSLIRIEADELTYPLHIIVRYELEKALVEGSLEVEDIQDAWNAKMVSYLGVEPQSDSEGVLQDIHWAEGLFGYFPSYALGTAFAAQFEHALRKMVDVDECLRLGAFLPINAWLKENIHKFGLRKKSKDIVLDATGEEFDPKYYIEYLKSKYAKLYDLDLSE